jgi:hypothetical protein
MEQHQEAYALTADHLSLRLDSLQPTALQAEAAVFSSRADSACAESVSEDGFEDRIARVLLPSPRDLFDTRMSDEVSVPESLMVEEMVEDTEFVAAIGAASSSGRNEISGEICATNSVTQGKGSEGATPSWQNAEGGLIGQRSLRKVDAGGKGRDRQGASKAGGRDPKVMQASRQPQPGSPYKTGRRSPLAATAPRVRGPAVGGVQRGAATSGSAGGSTSPQTTIQYPANHPKSLDPPKRHEPAKARVCADGRAMLRGVRSTSDLEKYASDVPLLSRSGAQTRLAFKALRSNQQASVLNSTWSAFHSLKASEQDFDGWFASAKQDYTQR